MWREAENEEDCIGRVKVRTQIWISMYLARGEGEQVYRDKLSLLRALPRRL